jgi:competence protein ComEC
MAPLLLPLIGFAAGILFSACLDNHSLWIALGLVAPIVCAKPRLAPFAVFLLGAALKGLEPPVPPDPGAVAVRLIGTLERRPEWRGPGIYLNVQVDAIDGRSAYGRARLTEFLEEPELIELFNQLDLGSGDRVEIVVKLIRPGVYRNPGVFDYRQYLERQRIYWTGTIRNPRLITVLDRGWHWPDRVHRWFEQRLEKRFADDKDVAGLMAGLALGRKSDVTSQVEQTFKAAGVYHLVVVSGFHFAVVMAATAWISRRVSRRRSWRFVVTLAAGLAYAFLVEGQTPALRALVMSVFVIGGRWLDRGHSSINAMAGSAFAILLWDPSELEDPSFQMTFAAAAAVIVFGAPAARWALERLRASLDGFDDVTRDGLLPIAVADWRVARRLWLEKRRLPQWVVTAPWRVVLHASEALIIAAAVESVFAYFMVESFHRLSPVSPLLNVPAGLVAAIATCGGLATIVLPDPLAFPIAWFVTLLLKTLTWMLEAAISLPGATVRAPSVPIWVWLAYAAVLIMVVAAVRHHRRWLSLAGGTVLGGLLSIMVWADFSPPPPASLTITALDVGQGDSILVEFPDGRRILVDGGGVSAGRFLGLREERGFSIGEDVVSAYLFSRGIRRLDTVVLTHAHNDHLDGLFDITENFKIGELWLGRNAMVPRYRDLLFHLSRRTIPIRWVAAGDRVGDDIAVLHPPPQWKVRKTAQNNDSVVLLIRSGSQSALLTGDLEIALPSAPEHVTLLKVPHHGSGGVRLRVKADLRLISVGANNPFGHPAASALPAVRTDQLGAVTVALPGSAEHPERLELSSALTSPCPSCKLLRTLGLPLERRVPKRF